MKKLLIASLAALTLAACDNDDFEVPNSGATTPTANIQILHGSPDAPPVNIVLNNVTILEDVDYKIGSESLERSVGTYSLAVDGILADGTTETVIGPADVTLEADTSYTVVAIGDVADIEPAIIAQPRTAVSAGSARVTVLHGASAAPAVDVYVTTPGADLAASAPLGTFSFRETLGPAEVAAGDYQVRVTPAGAPGTVVYDSGTIALADGNDLVIAALPNTTTGASPITLVAMTGSGTLEIPDVSTTAVLRVFHTSPDAPPVDLIVNDDFANPLTVGLVYGDFLGQTEVPGDDYNVKVTASGNPSAIVIDADVSLDAGEAYDVYAVDNLAAIAPLVLNDDPRPVALYAKVRIVHSSPTAQDVDIYVMAPGTDINTVSPTLADIPFAANTGYIPLPAGDYDIAVAPAGTKTAAIGPAPFMFEAGDVLTVTAIDAPGGGLPLGVIVTSDSIAP